MKLYKRIVSAFVIITFAFTCIFASVAGFGAAKTNKNTSVQIVGECKYDISYEILNELNKLRKSEGLSTLVMDSQLLEGAMQRASEITILYDHIRPDGSSFITIHENANAENIVLGFRDAKSAFESWKNSPKHYANMMNSKYKSIGIGALYHNDELFCVQVLSEKSGDNLIDVPINCDKKFNINLGSNTYNVNLQAPQKMYVGDSTDLTLYGETLYTNGYPSEFILNTDNFTFTSNKTSVITTDNNTIKAVGSGSATITAKSPAVTVTATINVVDFSLGGSRQCGDDIYWNYSNGVLTLSGSGQMYDYQPQAVPYFDALKDVNKVVVGEGITYIGSSAFSYFESLTDVVLPQTLTSIGNSAFAFCGMLDEISIPDNVTTLGSNLFEKCVKLSKITLPDKLKAIPSDFAANCWELDDLVIPNSVNSISARSFLNCSKLNNITMSDNITEIGRYAFSNCTSLTEFIVPSSVTKLDSAVFSGCTSLLECTILNSNIVFSGARHFELCSDDLTVYGFLNSTTQKYCDDNNISFAVAENTLRIKGDADNDGYITVLDATAIQLHVAQKKLLDNDSLIFADADKDGLVTVLDATAIQLHVAQKKPLQ